MSAAMFLALLISANPYLDEGRQLYRSMGYAEAEARLELATQVPSSSVEERREAFDLLARARLARGKAREAERAYSELLARDPHAPTPTDAAPKIRETFQRAKQRLYPPPFVRLELAPATEGRLEVLLVDPWDAVRTVHLHQATNAAFAATALALSERRALTPPLPQGMSYFLTAEDERGEVLERVGSASKPMQVPAKAGRGAPDEALPSAHAAPSEGAPAARWPQWALGGVAVAAVATGVVLAISSANDSRAAADAPFASGTAGLDQRAYDKALWSRGLLAAGALIGGGALVWAWAF